MPASFSPVASLKGQNVTSAAQFTRKDIEELLLLADAFREAVERGEPIELLKGRVMAPLFFENSSRTFNSFCAAMLKLGGSVLNFHAETSSIGKGETLFDTVKTMSCYSDVVVLRHPQASALDEVVRASKPVPVMNAGNGTAEHPSQALLDTFTMHAELGKVDGLVIALVGDLKNGRTVHSLVRLLVDNFDLGGLYFIAPEELQMPKSVIEGLSKAVPITCGPALTPELMKSIDVLYTTRLQKERFASSAADKQALANFESIKRDISVNAALLKTAKEKMIVMHPLPRVDELSDDVDEDPRAAYFRQMRYGLFMRMAILYSVLAV